MIHCFMFTSHTNLKIIIIFNKLQDAIKYRSFFNDTPKCIKNGDVEKAFAESQYILEGEARTGGQEHFYLETNATLAIPKEDELEIFCSTQHPAEIQKLISHVLNIHSHKIVVKAKRLGGGFGGKESRSLLLALPVAFAAYK